MSRNINKSMATKLNKPVHRESAKCIGSRPVIVTLAPCGSQSEARIGMRLKGARQQYVCLLSDSYRIAALWHGQAESKAKREARKSGISWRYARKKFVADHSI